MLSSYFVLSSSVKFDPGSTIHIRLAQSFNYNLIIVSSPSLKANDHFDLPNNNDANNGTVLNSQWFFSDNKSAHTVSSPSSNRKIVHVFLVV